MCRLFQSPHLGLLAIILVFVPVAYSQSQPILIGIVGDQYVAAAGIDPYPELTQAITLLRDEKSQAILHVGDLIEAKGVQSEADYKTRFDSAAQIMDQSGVPWFLTPGDHDVVPDLDMNDWTREATDHTREGYFLKLYAARKPQLNPKSLFYGFDFEGYHFVALYSIENLRADVRWGDVFRAEVSDDQLHWLEEDLSNHTSSQGTIVFTHQPLWYNAAAWQRVHRVLRDHHVLAVVAGHFHYSQDEGTTDGIRYIVVGASGAMVGAPGQDRSPEAGGHPIAMLMKLRPHAVEFEQKELRSGKVVPILGRHDLDRVQAFSQALSELDGDISQHTRICLDGNGQLSNPRRDVSATAPTSSVPSKQAATLDFCAIGNPIDVPADVGIQLLSDKATFDGPQFDSKFCETTNGASCKLRPGRRTAISNTSSVSFITCQQYNYFTKTDDQGGTDMFHAIIRASQPDSLKVNDAIPFQVTYRFRGDSDPLWVSQTFSLPVDACVPQGTPPGPLGDLDQLFIDSYTATRSTSIQTAPFVVVSGSSLILHRNAQKETARVIPDLYHALKDVAHVPFTVYLQLSPMSNGGQTLTDAQASALRDLSTKIDVVRHSLASGGYAEDEIPRQEQILNASKAIVSATLEQERVDSTRLRAFTRQMGPLMLLNARDAGCLQIQRTHAQMMKWKSTLSSTEWNSLVVVNRARHQARYRNAATQYFHWLFADNGPSWSYPGESMRVIYAESLGPNEDASDEFATVLIDAGASSAFFENPWRLTEDILSTGAEQCIKKLPDADRLDP